MKVTVIGASGFVGRHVAAEARRLGHAVVGTQSQRRGSELLPFDLYCDRLLDRLPATQHGGTEPAWCVICAAVVPMDRCSHDPAYARTVMVDNTIRLMEDAARCGIRSVFVSTGFVFDGQDGYYREDHPRNPISAYGRYKAEVEQYLESALAGTLVVRLDKVVGDDPAEEHLFSDWRRSLTVRKPLACIGGQLFAPTLVDDIARAILHCCAAGLSGTYHVAGREFFTRDELARQFLRAMGLQAEIVCDPHDAFGFSEPRPLRSYLDSSKLVRDTGLQFTPVSQMLATFKSRCR